MSAAADALIAEIGSRADATAETARRPLEAVDWSVRWRDGLGPRHFGRLTVVPSWIPEARNPDRDDRRSRSRDRVRQRRARVHPGRAPTCSSGCSTQATWCWTWAAAAVFSPSRRSSWERDSRSASRTIRRPTRWPRRNAVRNGVAGEGRVAGGRRRRPRAAGRPGRPDPLEHSSHRQHRIAARDRRCPSAGWHRDLLRDGGVGGSALPAVARRRGPRGAR